MKPKISFIMPQKNRGDRIAKSIQSIIDQTVPEWELVIINDHSDASDKTCEVVKGLNDERIKYFDLPVKFGTGIPEARNFGNALATAPIIAVADSDDIYSKDRAKITLETFKETGCDIFYGNLEIHNEPTGEKHLSRNFDPDFTVEKLIEKNIIAHSSSAYKREIAYQFPYNSFFRRGEDYDFFLRTALAGKKFASSKQVIYTYTVHDNNISGAHRFYDLDDLLISNHTNIESQDRAKKLKIYLEQI